jgi:hypothetical protein
MRWFRANPRFGFWCALFALTLQFLLAFGHVHVAGIGSSKSTLLAAVQEWAPAPDVPAAPAKHAPKRIAHDQCAICTMVQLAAAPVPAATAVLLLPQASSRAWLATGHEVVLAASPQFSFQARAPPPA